MPCAVLTGSRGSGLLGNRPADHYPNTALPSSHAGASLYVLAGSVLYFAAAPPLNWLLVHRLGWGLDGSALAGVMCEGVYAVALCALCMLHNARQRPGERWWNGWSGQALRGWGPFLRLSASSTVMILADWVLYDVATLLAGGVWYMMPQWRLFCTLEAGTAPSCSLGERPPSSHACPPSIGCIALCRQQCTAGLLPHPDVPLAATGISYSMLTVVFMMPYGLSVAVCARVGAHLGAARPRAAKLAGGALPPDSASVRVCRRRCRLPGGVLEDANCWLIAAACTAVQARSGRHWGSSAAAACRPWRCCSAATARRRCSARTRRCWRPAGR